MLFVGILCRASLAAGGAGATAFCLLLAFLGSLGWVSAPTAALGISLTVAVHGFLRGARKPHHAAKKVPVEKGALFIGLLGGTVSRRLLSHADILEPVVSCIV